MQDIELYQQVLGLSSPWKVSGVKLDPAAQSIVVDVAHAGGTRWRCPQCERELATYDHCEERTWRHLDTCQFRTLLRARVPRVNCPEHGVVQTEVPWAEPRGRFTMLFERFAMLSACRCHHAHAGSC